MNRSHAAIEENAQGVAVGETWIEGVVHNPRGTIRVHVDGAVREYPAQEILAGVAQVAAGLAAAGVSCGDHVALLCGQGFEWIGTDIAVQALGAVSVCLDPLLVDKVDWTPYAPLRAIVVDEAATEQRVAAKLGSASAAAAVFVVGPADTNGPYASWSDLLTNDGPAPVDLRHLVTRLSPTAAATVIWDVALRDSGDNELTPRVITHSQLAAAATAGAAQIFPGPTDACLSVLPLSVLTGRIVAELLPLATGCSSDIHAEPNEHDLTAVRPTVVVGTGPFWQRTAETLDRQVRSLRPEPEPLWSARALMVCVAAILTVVRAGLSGSGSSGLLFVSAFAAVAASAVALLGFALDNSDGARKVSASTFTPGAFGAIFLVSRFGWGSTSWSQLGSFLLGLSLVCAGSVIVVSRLKWWNAKLWLRETGAGTGRLRNMLWATPIRRLLGLDGCRIALTTWEPLDPASEATLRAVDVHVMTFDPDPDLGVKET